MNEQLPILVILVFFFGALLMPLVGGISRQLPWSVAVATSAVATVLSSLLLWAVLSEGAIRYELGGWRPPMGIELVADPLSAFMILLISAISLLVLLHSRQSVGENLRGGEIAYYASALLALGGFVGIVSTGDLFNLYVFLEISSLASYALLGAGGPRAAVGAFRYLILGTIGASFYLIGLGFVFIQTGSLNMADVAGILAVNGLGPVISVGVLFMVVGMGLKMALLPLHFWLPDAYTYAPAASTALIAPIGTKVAAYVLFRLVYDVFPSEALAVELHLLEILGILGAVGIVWGSVMAIPQDNLKRMLAYSSIAQVGYIALGLGLGTAYGFIGAILHILNHACMKCCLFLVSSNLESRGKGLSIRAFDADLRRSMPLSSAAFAVAAISMIGLPPTAGFFSKWYLLLGSLEEDRWIFIAVIILSSLLNAVYFFKILERMYLGGKEESGESGARPRGTFLLTFSPAVLAVALVVLGLGSGFIVTHVLMPMLPFAR